MVKRLNLAAAAASLFTLLTFGAAGCDSITTQPLAVAKAETLVDAFPIGPLSAKWHAIDENGGVLSLSGDQLLLGASLDDGIAGIISAASYDLTASQVSVQLVRPLPMSPLYAHDFVIGTDQFRQRLSFELRNGTLTLSETVNGVTSPLGAVTYVAGAMNSWRFRESSGQVIFEYAPSPHGPWTVGRSIADPFDLRAVAVEIVIESRSFNNATFDNVNVAQ